MFIIFYTALVAAYFVYCFQYDWKQINTLIAGILMLLGFIMWFYVIFA
jgi:hypothetical protein